MGNLLSGGVDFREKVQRFGSKMCMYCALLELCNGGRERLGGTESSCLVGRQNIKRGDGTTTKILGCD